MSYIPNSIMEAGLRVAQGVVSVVDDEGWDEGIYSAQLIAAKAIWSERQRCAEICEQPRFAGVLSQFISQAILADNQEGE